MEKTIYFTTWLWLGSALWLSLSSCYLVTTWSFYQWSLVTN